VAAIPSETNVTSGIFMNPPILPCGRRTLAAVL
jgi:hypothetical protein